MQQLYCFRTLGLKSFEEAEMFVKEKMSTAREIKGHFNDICEGIQKMIEFKPEVQENAENMMQLMKEFVERGGHRTSEARKLLKLLISLEDVQGVENHACLKQEVTIEDPIETSPLEHECNTMEHVVTIPNDSKIHNEKSDLKTSQSNLLSEDIKCDDKENTIQTKLNSQIKAHKDTHAKLEKITKMYTKYEKKVESLRVMKQRNGREIQNLKGKLEKKEQEMIFLRIELRYTEKLFKKERENVKVIQKQKRNVNEDLCATRKELQKYVERNYELNNEISVLKAHHEEGRKLECLQHDNNRANDKIKNLETIIAKNERISELEKNNVELESGRKEEIYKCQEKERENMKLTVDLKKYVNDNEKLNNDISVLKADYDEGGKSLRRLQDNNKRLNGKIINLEKTITKKNERISELQESDTKLTNSRKGEMCKCQEKERENMKLTIDLKKYVNDNEKLINDISVLKADCDEGSKSLQCLQDNNKCLNEKIINLEKIITKKNERINELQKSNTELTNSRIEEISKCQEKEKECKKLSLDLEKHKEENEKVNKLSQQKDKEKSKLSRELKDCKESIEKLNQDLQKTEEENRGLIIKVNAYKNDNEQLIQNLSKEQGINVRLIEELSTCKKENEKIKDDFFIADFRSKNDFRTYAPISHRINRYRVKRETS